MSMLSEVCAYLRNYFDDGQPHTFGEIEIKNGALFTPCNLASGQYFRIVNSRFNDGVYEFPTTALRVDETFNGAVWGMAVPPDLISLISEIEAWQAIYENPNTKEGKANLSPYSSEAFGGYSRSKGGGGGSYANGTLNAAGGATWLGIFGARLQRWRRL